MEPKTSLPNSLKNIFHEEENVCGEVVCECKATKGRRTGADGKRASGGDNRE